MAPIPLHTRAGWISYGSSRPREVFFLSPPPAARRVIDLLSSTPSHFPAFFGVYTVSFFLFPSRPSFIILVRLTVTHVPASFSCPVARLLHFWSRLHHVTRSFSATVSKKKYRKKRERWSRKVERKDTHMPRLALCPTFDTMFHVQLMFVDARTCLGTQPNEYFPRKPLKKGKYVFGFCTRRLH